MHSKGHYVIANIYFLFIFFYVKEKHVLWHLTL
jgi:hypothetical protein